jgi:SAM-dependent MidA family methyltransferase
MQMGSAPSVRLIEIGPGRGTLMVDALRVCLFSLSLHSVIAGCSLFCLLPFAF